jgi:mono/diheme cytochrome c family protein
MRATIPTLVLALAFAPIAYLGAQSKNDKTSANKPAAKPASGNLAKGKALYKEYCGICHYSENTAKKIGPGLKGIYKRGKFADGKKVDDTAMRDWIIKGGADMPSFEGQLTDEQIKDLIAYMRTL